MRRSEVQVFKHYSAIRMTDAMLEASRAMTGFMNAMRDASAMMTAAQLGRRYWHDRSGRVRRLGRSPILHNGGKPRRRK